MQLNWAPHLRSAEGTAADAAPQPSWPSRTEEPAPEVFEEPEAAPVGQRLAWLRQINFRSRVSALVAAAVGIAVALAALVSYVAVSRQMEQQSASNLQSAIGNMPDFLHPAPAGALVDQYTLYSFEQQWNDYVQVITPTRVVSLQGNLPLSQGFFPLSQGAKQALAEPPSSNPPAFETVTARNGSPYLVASVPSEVPGVVVQVGYRLSSVDRTLSYLRLVLILVSIGGVVLAGTLGWAVGRASMGPVEDLTLAAEHVTETQDLSATIDDTSNDELGRLARSFNAMLAALSASRQQQAQLVSDAGHELRTPLTSLRTNIEFLMRAKDLAGPERDELLSDVDAQLQELSTLVGDLVDLARDDERVESHPEPVALNEIVDRAVDRAQRRAMSVHFDVSVEPGSLMAQPAMLERAVMNVLDNAAKWSPPGGRVGVNLWASDGAWHLSVTDEGPGISAQDLPHIFDRFYRAPTARSMPGSGLGLAIVKRAITSHGGTIDVSCPPSGGTRVDISLPSQLGAGQGQPLKEV